MISSGELGYLLKVAENTAKVASKIIKKDLMAIKKIERDFKRDVKLVADERLESLIVEHLKKESHFPILSEEKGLICSSRNKDVDGYRWIVDPLDGSLNFFRSIPFCAISISLWRGMEPIFGIIHDFNRDETFVGLVNKGAWLNKKPIKVSMVKKCSKAVLCTGFPVSTNFSKEGLIKFVKDAMRFKKVRLFGSAALSLAYVACGRVDFYKEDDIKIWDVAGGLTLVKAAGGGYKISPTKKENIFLVEAANKYLLRGDQS